MHYAFMSYEYNFSFSNPKEFERQAPITAVFEKLDLIMKVSFWSCLFLLLGLICISHTAKILFYFGVSTYSHRITVWPLVEALADRGHTVTFLQANKNKNVNPKVEELELNSSVTFDVIDIFDMRLQFGDSIMFHILHKLPEMGVLACRETLSDPKIMDWINSNEVDVVVIDALFNDCALGLAHKWGAQTVIFGTTTVFEWWHDDFGFPAETNNTNY